MKQLAPVALFTYARCEHTRAVVESLLLNKEASQTDVIIFSDGAKTPAKEEAVSRNREYLHSIKGFKSINIIERRENWGLSKNLINGITNVVQKYGKVIVVEDDLILAPHFLEFMNDALDKYELDDKVSAISGYFPVPMKTTFFLRNFNCWGWATWERSWSLFRTDSVSLKKEINERHLTKAFDIDYQFPYYHMLDNQAKGSIDSWAIRFYASSFLNDSLVLYPSHPLVAQNGMDGSGTHSSENSKLKVELFKDAIILDDIEIQENKDAFNQLKKFCKKISGLYGFLIESYQRIKDLFN